MDWSISFFINSFLLGAGLAMDAFTVSLANGLNEPRMRMKKRLGIAGVFSGFQGFMPLAGWFCVHTVVQYFTAFSRLIPWIALILLGFIGGKMLIEGIRKPNGGDSAPALTKKALLMQGIATSIDALSVGFTIAEYPVCMAVAAAAIIAAVTFVICMAGLYLGKKLGMKLAGKASVLGGVILIAIGLKIVLW